MRVLSELALELYRACRHMAVERYQRWALDRLRARLPFDAGKWVFGHIGVRGPVIYSVALLDRPPEMLADYERVKKDDVLSYESVANPDSARLANAVAARPGLSREMVAYLEKWRIVHAAGCCTVDPFTRLATGIGLWRESRAVPFSEAERALFEAAMPHLVETFALNRIAHVLRMSQAPNAAHYASAVADAGGRLQAAPQQFLSLLRREWQDWRGPDLPADLGHFAAGEPRFVGREVFVRAARVDGLVLVQAREKRPADELTARELEIAHHVERGLSYRQIAARLGISAATVRTHLSAAYGKLAVRKQAELIARIAEAA